MQTMHFLLRLADFCGAGSAPACKNRSAAPGCGALLLLRPSRRACKRQTAAPAPLRLLRPQDAAQLRSHSRLPVSSAGRGRRSCKSFTLYDIEQNRRPPLFSPRTNIPPASVKTKHNTRTQVTEGETRAWSISGIFCGARGFALALLACVAAAAAVGVWAVRTVRDQMARDLGQDPRAERHRGGELPGRGRRNGQGGSDMAAAGGGRSPGGGGCARAWRVQRIFWCAVWVWFGVRTLRTANRITVERCDGRAIRGLSLDGCWRCGPGTNWSTMRPWGDWRTHNGVDYACEEGEDILCPVSGTVESLAAEGNWGVVASIRDAEGRLWRIAGGGGPGRPAGRAGDVGPAPGPGRLHHRRERPGPPYPPGGAGPGPISGPGQADRQLTGKGAAHIRGAVPLFLSRPSAHVGWTGLFFIIAFAAGFWYY